MGSEYEFFSSRREIEDLALIIQQWKKDHPGDDKNDYADRILDKLEYMHMMW